jgi:pyruvate kinase
MVARGDLALEIAFEDVPAVQRAALAGCAAHGKMSMVATQFLHSMRSSSRPTRAEVADITTAVRDGAGALVLTGETGYGKHPIRAVEVLRRVIERAERDLYTEKQADVQPLVHPAGVGS